MEISDLYSLFLEKQIITTDSRRIEKDSIFFALKGDKFDGNAYAKNAIKDGASLAVIDNPEYKINDKYILVSNVLETLQELAKYHVTQLKPGLKVVGLTGSNGKTTTKELIASVLKTQFKTQYTEGNLNNHIGVPLTILKIKNDTEVAVIEMGANHHGEIALLASIAKPDVGLITNIGEAHIEGFGSLKGVLEAKSELFEFLMHNDGDICLNVNDELLRNKFKANNYNNKICYGDDENTIVKGEIIESGIEKQKISLTFSESAFEFETKLVGSYNLDNFLAAATIGKYFKVPEKQIVEALSNYKPNLNRSQFVKTENNKLIVDAYNANPTSMEAALKNFSNLKDTNKIVILGGMKELGDESLKHHQNIVDLINSLKLDSVFLIGDEFSMVKHSFRKFSTVDELNKEMQLNKINNSTILIKGSRANKLEKVVPFL